MKFGLLCALLLVSQFTFAQTLKEKRVKEEMLTRVVNLLTLVNEAQDALDAENVVEACDKINGLFKLYPDHLMAIGTKMNLFDGKVIRMEQETKMQLIYFHQQKNICSYGYTGENLDIGEVKKKLKSVAKSLKKQKKRIKKSDTGYDNTYNYYYEFY